MADGTLISVRVYLAGKDPAGLTRYAGQASDPGSAGYRHYLTPAQFEQRFGPSGNQILAVRNWLTGAGLTVTGTTDHYVAAHGTAAAMQTAFGSQLHRYQTAQGTQQAPQSAVTIPSSVAPAVLTVMGLSTSTARLETDLTGLGTSVTGPGTGVTGSGAGVAGPGPGVTGPGTGVTGPVPIDEGACSNYWGQKPATTLPPAYGRTLDYALCGYVPHQLRAAYGVSGSGLSGKGATIAIVDPGASPTLASDVNTYMSRHGGQQLRTGQLTQYLPSDIAQSCAAQNSEELGHTEESLDVEAAHTMAPDADIAYVGADCSSGEVTPTDLLDAETRIVDGHLADIVSDSWHLGTTEATVTPDIVAAFQQAFEQGAAEGIGFYFSSGDHADWSATTPNHQPAVSFPGSDPWVTSVGGTSLAIGPNNQYEWETGQGFTGAPLSADGKSWAALPGSNGGGAGGGASSLFAQPSYQHGIVSDSLSHPGGASGAVRVMPDIAAVSDPLTGMLIGVTGPLTQGGTPEYVEGSVGGTSVATPLIAGIQADAQQAQGGVPIGFANPAIYARYGTSAYHDVTDHPLGGFVIAAVYEARDPVTGALSDTANTFGMDFEPARDTWLR